MVRLELTLQVNPEDREELEQVAREVQAALAPEQHRALLELSRAVCRLQGDLGQLQIASELPPRDD